MHLFDPTTFVASSGYAAIFILSVLQSCCVPTSSELTMGVAGVIAGGGLLTSGTTDVAVHHHLTLPGVILVGAAGELVGALIAYVIGRTGGRGFVDRFGKYVLLSHHDLDKAEAWYDRHSRFGVFGSRLLPVVRNFVAIPAGMAEVPIVRFTVLTAAGSLIWDGAFAGIGYSVGKHWHAIVKDFSDVGYVLAVLIVAAVGYVIWHRYRSYHAAMAAGAGSPAVAVGPDLATTGADPQTSQPPAHP